jgi:hypothetical protein
MEVVWRGLETVIGVPAATANGPMSGRACATMTARFAGDGICHPTKATT